MVVRQMCIVLIFSFLSCQLDVNSEAEIIDKDKNVSNFDVSSYKFENVSLKVENFVEKYVESNNVAFDVVFANVEVGMCQGCVRDIYSELLGYISSGGQETYVFINDSSYYNKIVDSNITYICLPSLSYKNESLFHKKIYLYDFKDYKVVRTRKINAAALEGFSLD
jgi:hypothetical protein